MSRTIIKGQTVYGVPSIVTNGLVLYLDAGNKKSYSGSGTSWFDISGNSYTSTLAFQSYSSEYGGAIVGANNTYATIPTININTDYTYQWVVKKTSDITPVLVGNIFSNGMVIYFTTTSITIFRNTVGTVIDFGSNTATSLNIPYIITIKLIKSTNTFYCYINGVLKNSVVYTPAFKTDSQTLMRVGSGVGLTGNLYSFMSYNRALSDAEVLQNFTSLKGRYGL